MALRERILLATDLSARSDRALDRATMLARQDDAALTVVHVLEPIPDSRYYPRDYPLEDLAAVARAHLAHDLGPCAARSTVRIEEGDPAEVVERLAGELSATLVVVGVARTERLGRFALGSTTDRLVRRLDAPLLIVTDRARGPYARIAVAVDFSPVSSQILALATESFPDQAITVFHAYEPPLSYATSDLVGHREEYRKVAERDCAEWLSRATLTPASRSRVTSRIEFGEPSLRLAQAAAQGDFDLIVVGSTRRGPVSGFLIGSVGKRILAGVPCDALFVREART